jgi:hypothetical protein
MRKRFPLSPRLLYYAALPRARFHSCLSLADGRSYGLLAEDGMGLALTVVRQHNRGDRN